MGGAGGFFEVMELFYILIAMVGTLICSCVKTQKYTSKKKSVSIFVNLKNKIKIIKISTQSDKKYNTE